MKTQKELLEYIDILKTELGQAMFCKSLVRTRCVEVDPAGNTYEVNWTDEARRWAILAGIDLKNHDPTMQ